jgi:hypothetical protein
MDEDDVRRLFARKPRQWGLRGDPYAWEAMRIDVQAAERPPDADALLILLDDVFYRRVGVELRADDTPDSVYVPSSPTAACRAAMSTLGHGVSG